MEHGTDGEGGGGFTRETMPDAYLLSPETVAYPKMHKVIFYATAVTHKTASQNHDMNHCGLCS